ncbi:hypothetical protein [Nostoc sp. NMS8]|uniref:hypothetical protein n=1 Tax=Nostoc sp. NMS8 TaxID=2815392 RepID=UPI0025E5252C|nr:hypothetical protein [Nostoc sp. NMS8]MBN3960791.1 hypothetical protein [Nostoc sp. NMS8]
MRYEILSQGVGVISCGKSQLLERLVCDTLRERERVYMNCPYGRTLFEQEPLYLLINRIWQPIAKIEICSGSLNCGTITTCYPSTVFINAAIKFGN